jgi:hypothetical protein
MHFQQNNSKGFGVEWKTLLTVLGKLGLIIHRNGLKYRPSDRRLSAK